jgi:hypothetical protein
MSNPITAQAQLQYNNSAGINVSMPPTSFDTANVAITGSHFIQATMSVPTTSGGTAIPVTDLANLGLACFQNLDPTNYIDLLSAASGTAFARLLPGDPPFLFRFNPGITAPAALAHTAACNLQYMILEN